MVRPWFDDYVEGFRESGTLPELLELKRVHSLRVADNTRKIATALQWPDPDVDRAEAVGLLHDIGRFPQYRDYQTFSDEQSVDHGELGAAVLERDFPWPPMEKPARRALVLAVRHHNAKAIPDHLPALAVPLLRVLRDGDKLDVLDVVRQWTEAGRLQDLLPPLPPSGPLDPTILGCLAEGRPAPFTQVRSLLDYHLIQLGWVFDLSYAPSHRELLARGLLDWLLSRLSHHEEVAPLLAAAEAHVRCAAARQPSATKTPIP